MIKKIFSLFAAILFAGTVWGQAAAGTTLFSEDFSSYSADDVPSGSVATSTGRVVYDGGSVTYTCTDNGKNLTKIYEAELASGKSPELLVGKSGGVFTIAGIPSGDAKEISVSFKQNAQKLTISLSGKGYSTTYTSPKPSAPGTVSFDITVAAGADATFSLIMTAGSSNVRVDDILVTVKVAGTPSGCTNTVTITKGEETNGTYTIGATEVCGDGDGGEVSISDINPAIGYEFDEITTSASGTVDNDNKKVTGITANTTITVLFKEIPKYTVTFDLCISTYKEQITEEYGDQGIELPDGPELTCADWKFVGWAEAKVASETTTAPTLFAAGANYKPASNCTLYAVYKRSESGSGEEGSVTITTETTNFPTSYGDANTFTEYTLEGYKFKIQQIYVTGTGANKKQQWRAAGNGSGTGTIYNSQTYPGKITSIVLTYHSSDSNKNHTLKVGGTENPTGGTSITGTTKGSVETFDCSAANADYFVLANGEYAGYTTSIEINYGAPSTNYYYSTPSCYPTSVDNTVDGKKAVKFIENGQLFIELNGHIYNVQGQTVK